MKTILALLVTLFSTSVLAEEADWREKNPSKIREGTFLACVPEYSSSTDKLRAVAADGLKYGPFFLELGKEVFFTPPYTGPFDKKILFEYTHSYYRSSQTFAGGSKKLHAFYTIDPGWFSLIEGQMVIMEIWYYQAFDLLGLGRAGIEFSTPQNIPGDRMFVTSAICNEIPPDYLN